MNDRAEAMENVIEAARWLLDDAGGWYLGATSVAWL